MKYNVIYDRIRYFISLKYGIAYVFSHSHARTKINSDDGLPLEKILTMHNTVIVIKDIINSYNCLLETPVLQSKQSMTI